MVQTICARGRASTSTDRLVATCGKVDKRLREIKVELRSVRRKHAVSAQQWNCQQWKVALRVMQLTQGHAGAASTYLCKVWERATVDVVMDALQSSWETASPTDKQPLGAEAGAACRAQRRAHRFLAEASLHHFVESTNLRLGIAPSNTATVAAAQRCAVVQAYPVVRYLPPGIRRDSQRQRIQRWHRRWGVKLARIGCETRSRLRSRDGRCALSQIRGPPFWRDP